MNLKTGICTLCREKNLVHGIATNSLKEIVQPPRTGKMTNGQKLLCLLCLQKAHSMLDLVRAMHKARKTICKAAVNRLKCMLCCKANATMFKAKEGPKNYAKKLVILLKSHDLQVDIGNKLSCLDCLASVTLWWDFVKSIESCTEISRAPCTPSKQYQPKQKKKQKEYLEESPDSTQVNGNLDFLQELTKALVSSLRIPSFVRNDQKLISSPAYVKLDLEDTPQRPVRSLAPKRKIANKEPEKPKRAKVSPTVAKRKVALRDSNVSTQAHPEPPQKRGRKSVKVVGNAENRTPAKKVSKKLRKNLHCLQITKSIFVSNTLPNAFDNAEELTAECNVCGTRFFSNLDLNLHIFKHRYPADPIVVLNKATVAGKKFTCTAEINRSKSDDELEDQNDSEGNGDVALHIEKDVDTYGVQGEDSSEEPAEDDAGNNKEMEKQTEDTVRHTEDPKEVIEENDAERNEEQTPDEVDKKSEENQTEIIEINSDIADGNQDESRNDCTLIDDRNEESFQKGSTETEEKCMESCDEIVNGDSGERPENSAGQKIIDEEPIKETSAEENSISNNEDCQAPEDVIELEKEATAKPLEKATDMDKTEEVAHDAVSSGSNPEQDPTTKTVASVIMEIKNELEVKRLSCVSNFLVQDVVSE